jgi:hypothetical protein
MAKLQLGNVRSSQRPNSNCPPYMVRVTRYQAKNDSHMTETAHDNTIYGNIVERDNSNQTILKLKGGSD